MSEPTAFLLALRASTAELVKELAAGHWSDSDVGAPSLLPGWTRGHVLTHVARNADGISDTLAGALRGEVVLRYPHGMEGRNADIEAGAGRPYSALFADVRDSAERLDRVLGAVGDADGWALPTENEVPAADWVFKRWREVEIHRVDLDAGYSPSRWPALYVAEELTQSVEFLAERVDGAVHVTIAAEGSVVRDLGGREWTVGEGAPVDVRGPDWAVLSWLIGRPTVAGDALSETPPLRKWR